MKPPSIARPSLWVVPSAFLLSFLFCDLPQARADGAISWPLPQAPEGTNPAVFPVPRNNWMERFESNKKLAPKGAVDLVFEGDSITANWTGPGKEVWDEKYQKRAVDFGMGGDRTDNVLWRLQNGELDGIQPKLILLLIGTNNLWRDKDPQIVEGIKAVVDELKKRCPDSTLLLQGVFPRGEKPNDSNRARIKTINEGIAGCADGKKVLFLDFGDKFLAADGTLKTEIMPDFLHPSVQGYRIWAAEIQPVIDRYAGSAP